jgi:hypothetical protein
MIDDSTHTVLEDPALEIPKVSQERLVDFLTQANARFAEVLGRFKGRLGDLLHDRDRRYWIDELA